MHDLLNPIVLRTTDRLIATILRLSGDRPLIYSIENISLCPSEIKIK